MRTIANFVFLCALLAPKVQGQTFGTLEQPREYLEAVTEALWVKIKDHGISNLPVLDASLPYNFTAFGVQLIGLISFVDGFIQDIDSVSLSPQNFQSSAPLAQASISGRVVFENLRLLRDLRADLATGMKVGTIVFTPASFAYDLSVTRQHDDNAVPVPVLSFFSYSNLVWDSIPDDMETRLMQRQLLNQTNLFAPNDRPQLVSTTAQAWIPLFTEFLNEIVSTIEFPRVLF